MASSNVLRRLAFVVDVDDHASKKLAQIDMMGDRVATNYSAAAAQMKLFKSALKATGVVAIGAAAGIAAITWQGAKLDRNLATIKATTNATTETMGTLREEIQRIGTVTPATILDAAGAFQELSYAGFQAKEILKSGMDVVELAVAGNLDMAQAAKITAQNLRAFNMEANQAGAVSNTLAAVFASSATEINQLANGLSYVNATASQLGLSLSEVTAALGVLADNAIEGTRAGTSLNQAFAKLFAQTGKVKKALDAVGLSIQSFTDEQGNVKDLSEMLRVMKTRMDELDMSRRGRVAWATDVFGRRGARAILPLLEDLDALEQKQEDVGFAQLKSEIRALSDLGEDQKLLDLEKALFGKDLKKFDLSETPSPDALLKQLRKRYGRGEAAAQQISQALQQAFPDMEQFAAEKVADQLAAQSVSVQELAQAYDVSTKRAAQMAAQMTETEKVLAVSRRTMDKATTDAEIYGEFMERVGGQLQYLKGSITAVADRMFIGLAPILNDVLATLIDWADALQQNQKLLEGMGKALFYVATAATAATTALAGLFGLAALNKAPVILGFLVETASKGGMLAPIFVKLQGVIGGVLTALGGLATYLGGAVTSITSASGVLGTLSAVVFEAGYGIATLVGFIASLNPITLALIAIIGTATAIFAAWATDFKNFRSKTKPFVKGLDEATEGVQNFVGDALDVAMWALTGFYDFLDDTGTITAFINGLAGVANEIGRILYVTSRILHYFGQFVKLLVDPVGTFKEWGVFETVMTGIRDRVKETVHWLNKIPGINIDMADIPGMANGDAAQSSPKTDGTPDGEQARKRARKAGQAQQEGYAQGIKDKQKKPGQAFARSMGYVGDRMPKSDAKKGPLSDLTQRGRATLTTFAKGMRQGRHNVTDATGAAMERVARLLRGTQLDPDDLAEPLQTVQTAASDLVETTEATLDALRDLDRFSIIPTGITQPLQFVKGVTTGLIGMVEDAYNWLIDLDQLGIDVSGILDGFDKLIQKSQTYLENLLSIGEEQDNTGVTGGGDGGGGGGGGGDDGGGGGGGDGAGKKHQPPITAKNTGEMTPSDYPGRPGTRRGSKARKHFGRRIEKLEIQNFRGSLSADEIQQIRSRYGIKQDEKIPAKVWRKEMRRRLDTPTESDDPPPGQEAQDDDDDDGQQRRGRPGGGGFGTTGTQGPPMSVSVAPEVTAPLQQGKQAKQQADSTPTERAMRAMQKQRLAAHRALQRAQPLMPKAFNAVRSDLIPDFVPTYGGGGGGTAPVPGGGPTEGDTSGETAEPTPENETGEDGPTASAEDTNAAGPATNGGDINLNFNPEVAVDGKTDDPDATVQATRRALEDSVDNVIDELSAVLREDTSSSGGN